MTTRWRPGFDPNHLYFITTKAVHYKHLFRRDIVKRIVVDALYIATVLSRATVYAFVVMPNHIHALLQCQEDHRPGYWVRTMKTTSARLIVRQYEVEGNQEVLNWLADQVKNPKRQAHKVWEDNYLAKAVVSECFMLQKLTYIHENPVQPHWELVDSPAAYAWSSAAFYEGGASLIPVQSALELLG